jgi:hypothetical protein
MTGRLATLAVIFGIVLALVPGAARTQEDVGSLAISGSVDGAEIFVGDQRIGTLRAGYALVADNVPSGPQRVTARRSGYRDWERTIQVIANQRTSVTVDMEAVRVDQPPPYVGGRGRVLFEDDFIRGERRAWVGSDKTCAARYEDSGYWVKSNNGDGTCEPRLTYAGQFEDAVRVELTVRLRGGPQNHLFGIKFGRAANDNNDLYAVFGISANGSYRLTQWHQGKWNQIIDWTKDAVVRTGYGATNHLAVEVAGRKIRCYINDKFVGTGTAFGDVRGYLGLYLNEKDMEADFTNLRVLELQR